MPAIETSIFQALKARVNTLPMIATYPVVWATDDSYKPTASTRFLRVTWIPNRVNRIMIGSTDPHQRPGLLQIDVMERKTVGEGVAIEIAGQVAEHFPADLPMDFDDVCVRVTQAPDVGPVFVATHIQVPVTVRVETFA
jgi:hypothetical protein